MQDRGQLAGMMGPNSPHSAIALPAIQAVDASLRSLIPALVGCGAGRTTVIALEGPITGISLLPVQLHARWPDALPWLPMTCTFSVLPFTASDLATASYPLYRVGDARDVRRAARLARNEGARAQPGDFQHPDWEMSEVIRNGRLDDLVLPARAYVSIHRIQPDGSARSLPRPKLGRHAKRDTPCARVLVPGARHPSRREIEVLSDTDLLIIDLQRLRGPRTIRLIRAVLAQRELHRPTLLVAASPADLFAVGIDSPPGPSHFFTIGKPSPLDRVHIAPVGRDRLAAEERFTTALSGLAEQSPASAALAALAENAWWSTRQGINSESGSRERRSFELGLENLERQDAYSAGAFTACRDLIRAAAADLQLQEERSCAVLTTVMSPGIRGSTLILTRSLKDAAALRALVAGQLALSEQDLETLEIGVRSVRGLPPTIPPDVVIVVGYAGMAAIDAALASRARLLHAVFDPVEARVAWYAAQRAASYFVQAGASDAAVPLQRFAEQLSPYVAGIGTATELRMDSGSVARDGTHPVMAASPAPGEAVICLTDGTLLHVSLGARFEVLGRNGFGSHVRLTSDLAPGDQIVLLDEGARSLFSEQRISAIDAGPLRAQSQSRRDWLTLVRAVTSQRKLSVQAIVAGMTLRGQPITAAAVSSWLNEKELEARTPIRADRFHALADVLGLQLPKELLHKYYQDIHDLRVRHRRAGREVAQAIRLAYSGRLGAETLARVEKNWGVAVRALIAAAQVGVVDDVILPEGEQRAER